LFTLGKAADKMKRLRMRNGYDEVDFLSRDAVERKKHTSCRPNNQPQSMGHYGIVPHTLRLIIWTFFKYSLNLSENKAENGLN